MWVYVYGGGGACLRKARHARLKNRLRTLTRDQQLDKEEDRGVEINREGCGGRGCVGVKRMKKERDSWTERGGGEEA